MQDTDLGLLILRGVVGLTLAGHGAQKAFGWWSGPGLEGWRGAVTAMGFRPVGLWTAISIGAELVGGLALAIGFLTPVAAALLLGQTIVIIVKVHLPNGFWNGKGGIEFPLSLCAAVVAIGLIGPGPISIDGLVGFTFEEPVRIVLLLVGAVGGVGALLSSRVRRQEPSNAHA